MNAADEPITFEWLESLGFRPDGTLAVGYKCGEWWIFKTPDSYPYGRWQVRWGLTVVNRHRRFDTRGDLMELWRLLGVPWALEADCANVAQSPKA